jgi:hypothetical protein
MYFSLLVELYLLICLFYFKLKPHIIFDLQRPPQFVGRDDRETLLASTEVKDWIKISEMILGKAPPGFTFEPKHKSNSYAEAQG